MGVTPSIKLRPSRLKRAFLFIISFLLTLGSALALQRHADPSFWVLFLIFGLASVLTLLSMNPKFSYLLLNEEGFTVAAVLKKKFVPWKQIESFTLGPVPSFSLFWGERKRVFYNLREPSPKFSSWGNLNQKFLGAAGMLPDNYRMSAENLLALLNDWKNRNVGVETSQEAPAEAALPQAQAVNEEKTYPPYATLALIVFLALVFAAQILFAVRPWKGSFQSDILTLEMMGGMLRGSVLSGEWYRMITASFLHLDLFHLLFNCIALFFGGRLL